MTIHALHDTLGPGLLAVITNRDVKAVTEWTVDPAAVPAEAANLLRATYQVLEIVTEVDTAAVARAWFMGMNEGLDDQSPAEVIAAGRANEVMAAARHFVSAG